MVYHSEGYTLYRPLAYPPAPCSPPVSAKGKQSLNNYQTPLLCVFFWELNPLGDSVGPASGLHLAPPWCSGVLWDPSLFCMGSSAVCVYRTPCLTVFLSFTGLVLPRNLSLVRLSFLASPPLHMEKENKVSVCVLRSSRFDLFI